MQLNVADPPKILVRPETASRSLVPLGRFAAPLINEALHRAGWSLRDYASCVRQVGPLRVTDIARRQDHRPRPEGPDVGEPSPSGGGRRAAPPSVAFVTVSYGPDRDRCRLLCRSLDALGPPKSGHLIIVDRADLAQFSELETGSRRIIATEDVLPSRVWRLEARRVGLRSNVFLHLGKPVRGWLVQQLVKLAACRDVAADIIVHADSDVALVRPFDTDSLVDAEGASACIARPA